MMFRYELKKILGKKSAIIALAVLGVWMLGSLCFVVGSASWVCEENGKTIYGLEAVHMIKSEKSKWNGLLTPEVISEVIRENIKIINNPEYQTNDSLNQIGYAKTQSYKGIRELVTYSFCGFQTYDYYVFDKLSPGQSHMFYKNRINSVKEWADDDNKGVVFSDREKEFFIRSAETLETPFEYSCMEGWNNVLKYCSMILFVNIIIVCILLAPAFAIEYQTGSDAVLLSTLHGKGRVVTAKLTGSYVIATVVYWFSVLAFCGGIFAIYGTDGGNCPIQANSYCWKSFYHLTNAEAFWLLLGLGYVGCLLMASITLWMSAKMKTSFSAIILAFIVIIVPQMVNTDGIPAILRKITELMPHQTTIGINLLRLYNVYQVSDIILTLPQMITRIYLLLCLILLPLTVKAFKHYQPA